MRPHGDNNSRVIPKDGYLAIRPNSHSRCGIWASFKYNNMGCAAHPDGSLIPPQSSPLKPCHHPTSTHYKNQYRASALLQQNDEPQAYCMRAKRQMEADHASKQLMDAENQCLTWPPQAPGGPGVFYGIKCGKSKIVTNLCIITSWSWYNITNMFISALKLVLSLNRIITMNP